MDPDTVRLTRKRCVESGTGCGLIAGKCTKDTIGIVKGSDDSTLGGTTGRCATKMSASVVGTNVGQRRAGCAQKSVSTQIGIESGLRGALKRCTLARNPFTIPTFNRGQAQPRLGNRRVTDCQITVETLRDTGLRRRKGRAGDTQTGGKGCRVRWGQGRVRSERTATERQAQHRNAGKNEESNHRTVEDYEKRGKRLNRHGKGAHCTLTEKQDAGVGAEHDH